MRRMPSLALAIGLAEVGVGRDGMHRAGHRVAGALLGGAAALHEAQDVAFGDDAHGSAGVDDDNR